MDSVVKSLTKADFCTDCGLELCIRNIVISDGTLRRQIYCEACGKKFGFAPMDNDPTDFKMPFGKYKDYTLREILAKDRPYLQWCAQKIDNGTVKRRILQILERLPVPMSQTVEY